MKFEVKNIMGQPDENGNYVSKNGWYIPKEVVEKAMKKYFDENPDKAWLLSEEVKQYQQELDHPCNYSIGFKNDN